MTDEEEVRLVAQGDPEAVRRLYARYAPLVLHIATQSLDAHAAEDLVQEVFLQVWKRAETFDPRKGPFRPWLLQIAHFRILNELRRRSRQPQESGGDQAAFLEELPDPDSQPSEAAWADYRKRAVQEAVDRLPASQRQALSLAFFEELSHEQVARALKLPLGTVKTRIRSALFQLRRVLAPTGIVLVLIGTGLGILFRTGWMAGDDRRSQRALELVSSSDTREIHLSPAPGFPPLAHGWYRSRVGIPTVVMALHKFPPAPPGTTYQGWVKLSGEWVSLGTALPDADGNAVLTSEAPRLAQAPQQLQVTREPAGGSPVPRGEVVILSNP